MQMAVFSDVHANLEALEVALSWYESLDVEIDRYAYLGDIVGYGPNPEECVDRIKGLVDYAVIGNHDAAVAGRMDYSFYHQKAKEALDWHRDRLSQENIAWLESLPYRQAHEDIRFTHGSPQNIEEFEYVFNVPQADALINDWERLGHVNFIGHSHLTKSFELDQSDGATELDGNTLQFESEKKYIVTAGSVGQPRDNDNRACVGLYDTDNDEFHFERLEYEISETAEKIFDSDLADEFGKRLFFGI
jgi:diadenosine tetraphosphatase ApaH/serine/threonine PP2A family protein phosphatase